MNEKKILIIYYSSNGSTRKIAELIAQGVDSITNCEAVLRTVPSVSNVTESIEPKIPSKGAPYVETSDLENCDGLAIGSPTRFGNMASSLKYFIDSTSNIWLSGALAGKPACVFTSTGSIHGGQESTLLSMMLPLLHHGMIIVGIPYTEPELMTSSTGGSPYGATHWSGSKNEKGFDYITNKLAISLGKRLAEISKKIN